MQADPRSALVLADLDVGRRSFVPFMRARIDASPRSSSTPRCESVHAPSSGDEVEHVVVALAGAFSGEALAARGTAALLVGVGASLPREHAAAHAARASAAKRAERMTARLLPRLARERKAMGGRPIAATPRCFHCFAAGVVACRRHGMAVSGRDLRTSSRPRGAGGDERRRRR